MIGSLQAALKKHEKVIGSLASILGTIISFSLIEIAVSNIQGESKIFIQPLATVLNCSFWSLYVYGRKDRFLLIPNLLGLVPGVTTVIFAFI